MAIDEASDAREGTPLPPMDYDSSTVGRGPVTTRTRPDALAGDRVGSSGLWRQQRTGSRAWNAQEAANDRSKKETRTKKERQRQRNNQPVGHATIYLGSEGPESGYDMFDREKKRRK